MAKPINALITACGSRTATHSIIDSLAKSNKYTVNFFGCDTMLQPRTDERIHAFCSANNIQVVKQFVEQHNIDVIFPLIEEDLLAFSADAELAKRMLGPGPQLAKLMCDKLAVMSKLSHCSPEFYSVSAAGELKEKAHQLGYPQNKLILKPRFGRGGRGIYILSEQNSFSVTEKSNFPSYNLAEAQQRLSGNDEFILTRFIHGDEYTVFCFAVNGEMLVAVPLLRDGFTPGITWSGRIEKNKNIGSFAAAVAAAFNYSGFYNLQLRMDGHVPKLLEINPRFSGTAGIATEAGVNLPEMMLDLHFNEPLQPVKDFAEFTIWRDVREHYIR